MVRPYRHRVPVRRLIPTVRHASLLFIPCAINRAKRRPDLHQWGTRPRSVLRTHSQLPTSGVATITGIRPFGRMAMQSLRGPNVLCRVEGIAAGSGSQGNRVRLGSLEPSRRDRLDPWAVTPGAPLRGSPDVLQRSCP